jgi:phenylacetic acid degradation operon negative regulatory protein
VPSASKPDNRAFTARSVLLSVLLGTDPPRLPVSLLVSTTELFGIAEGTTRTALSRMVASGELAASDGRYEIASPRLLHRHARQARSRQGATRPWSGEWIEAVVAVEGRRPAAERAALRTRLHSLRLAELREGVWLRPDNLAPPDQATAGDNGEVVWFRARLEGDPAQLAQRLWDLAAWATEAESLRVRLAELSGPLEAGDRTVLAEGFVLSAAVLRHFQADPLLPAELLPSAWPGEALRDDYGRYDAAYRTVLREWFDEHR